MRRSLLVIGLGGILCLTGCATFSTWAALSPLDRAKATAVALTDWYERTNADVQAAIAGASPDLAQKYKERVLPVLDRFGRALLVYVDCVDSWAKNGVKPADHDATLRQVTEIQGAIVSELGTIGGQ